MDWQKIAFVTGILLCLMPFVSPPVALAVGLVFALTIGNPFPSATKSATKLLLQICVVMLGFGMNLTSVIKAGSEGVIFTIVTIFGTLVVGYLLGKLLLVNEKTSALVSSGTAICGGSAIAAVAPAINADSEDTSVSLATIFILNSVALFVFPSIGHAFGMSENQFGIWAAIAIHDTSSVVGASQAYGAESQQVATTVKLARALWIAPVALLFSYLYRDKDTDGTATIAVPWFIFLFLAATVVRTYTPENFPTAVFQWLVQIAKTGLTVTLFLIGASLSRQTLLKVGWRPLLQGILLWLLTSAVSLFVVLRTV